MTERDRLRELLEPEAPHLSGAAASRLDARVEAALAGPSARRVPRWAFMAAPALLALLALAWLRPWQGEAPRPEAGGYFLLSEEDYLSALADYQASGGSVDSVLTTEESEDEIDLEIDHSNWSNEDWKLFQSELEDFQLTDNGGK